MHRLLLVLVCVLAALGLLGQAPGAGTRYTVTDLGTLEEGNAIVLRALNAAGDVAGSSVSGPGHRGFIRGRGRLDRVGTLPGGDHSVARGINDAGDVVGSSNTATAVRAVRHSRGVVQDLGTLPGDSASEAFAINQRGDVV